MKNEVQIGVRLPKKIVLALDDEAKRLSKEIGIEISRSDVVRRCILNALPEKKKA
jgi:hypothetical protein